MADVFGNRPVQHEINNDLVNIDTLYELRSMFCYYGQHYFAFIYKPEVGWPLIFHFFYATVFPARALFTMLSNQM